MLILQKGSITPPSQPIPQDVEALSGANFDEKDNQKGGETDSITGEIAEGRTIETSKKYSNWVRLFLYFYHPWRKFVKYRHHKYSKMHILTANTIMM